MALRDMEWVVKRTANGCYIPHDRIIPPSKNKYGNVRPKEDITKDTIAQRANSLILEGQRHALTGYLSDDESTFELTDGEIRYHAWKYAKEALGTDLGPVYCETGKRLPKDESEASKQIIYFQVNSGTNTKPLSTAGKAVAVKKLRDLGESTAAIAEKMGCTGQHVRDLLKYIDVDPDIKQAVEDGKISASAAIKTARARKETQDEVKEKLENGESVKGKDLDGDNLLTPKEIKSQIKKAEKRWYEATSEKEKLTWEGVVKGLRISLGMADKL